MCQVQRLCLKLALETAMDQSLILGGRQTLQQTGRTETHSPGYIGFCLTRRILSTGEASLLFQAMQVLPGLCGGLPCQKPWQSQGRRCQHLGLVLRELEHGHSGLEVG